MVKNNTLLLIAGLVWLLAGANIVYIGLQAAQQAYTLLAFCGSVLIFFLFQRMFRKIVHKHTQRIADYTTAKQYFWHFFDRKSFLIMAIMMTAGISIRTLQLMPEICIASFYCGLGLALMLAGLLFLYHYLTHRLTQARQ